MVQFWTNTGIVLISSLVGTPTLETKIQTLRSL